MIYSSTEYAYNRETIFDKCKNHVITLLIVKSTTNKIMGGLIPIKFQELNAPSALPDNSSFVFFYDDNKLRKSP